MHFLANENIPFPSVFRLREAKLNVASVLEEERGLNDKEVIALANKSQRIIITFDSDYGTLIYREGLKAPAGVIYLRFTPYFPAEAAEIILSSLEQSSLSFAGVFTVITRNRIRQRPLP